MYRVCIRVCKQYTHYIGRGSIYSNPFTHLPVGRTQAAIQCISLEQSLEFFSAWLDGDLRFVDIWPLQRLELLKAIPRIPENAVLGCYCNSPYPLNLSPGCHGDIIMARWKKLKGVE